MRSNDIDWAAYMEPVARLLCGEPNKALSSRGELRFGTKGSLRVSIGGPNKGTWRDHENNVGGGVLKLIQHKLGFSNGAAIDWFKSNLHVDMADIEPAPKAKPATRQRVESSFIYHDEYGNVLYRVLRWGPARKFVQNPPDGKGGWIIGEGCMAGVRRVPYRLDEWRQHPERALFIAEGEKDVDRVRSLGLLATCNVGGAGSWLPYDKYKSEEENAAAVVEFVALFQGRTIIVLSDNDKAGFSHRDDIVHSLLPVAAEIRVVELPGVGPKADISDWLDAGGEKGALLALVEAAQPVQQAQAERLAANVVPLRPRREGGPDEAQEPPEDAPSLRGEPLNDIGNAKRLIASYGPLMRFVIGTGWHVWDGCRYKHDPATVHSRKLAHQTARDMLVNAFEFHAVNKEQERTKESLIKFCVGSGNSNRINSMLSQAEPYLASESNDLDKDPWLLNCLNGTVDLRTGDLRPHDYDDLITKICGTDYDPRALCPRWEQFMLEIFDGDTKMVEFVQRAIGYSLTGMTNEQVVFIMHGSGSNGKSVLLETIAAVLADYVKRSPADTWVSKPANGPSNDIAALAGARFVSVVETEHERQLAEALVKQATGGDAMTARFLHKEFFSFIPKFKLWFATNHKPKIRGSDFAIWRRIILLPFSVTFNDEDKIEPGQKKKDPGLRAALAEEYAGILAWMIRGCQLWQETGLRPPEAITDATESYQDSQDNVSGFIRDNCWLRRSVECPVGLLYAAYQIWCEENDEEALSSRALGKNLDERGLPPGPRDKHARKRKGIDLKDEFKAAAALRQAADKIQKDVAE